MLVIIFLYTNSEHVSLVCACGLNKQTLEHVLCDRTCLIICIITDMITRRSKASNNKHFVLGRDFNGVTLASNVEFTESVSQILVTQALRKRQLE